jgi:methylthioribose-1-phosphate isomerase
MHKTVIEPIVWKNGVIRIIDQTRLPGDLVYEECRTVESVWQAIKKLKVRGAPLIGIAGAMGFLLGMHRLRLDRALARLREAEVLRRYLSSSRPTAVNLSWALERMESLVRRDALSPRPRLLKILKDEVDAIIREDIDMCSRMSTHAACFIHDGDAVMTVCNAGGLATSGYGTALGVFYRAKEDGKKIKVYACETRPLLQGARLTAWELKQNRIDVTLICDNMAASVMRDKKIKGVFVGADRIAANGDFANKIGTYSLAVLAGYHKIPFYCVAPCSTFDLRIRRGQDIPIEERDPKEVTELYFKKPVAPKRVPVFNPAFDVTPADLVTAIITEKGVIRAPFAPGIQRFYGDKK